MPASLIGNTGSWGIDAPQGGLIIQGQDENTQSNEKEVLNEVGEVTGLSMYNDRVDISIHGLATAVSPFSTRLAATLAMANVQSDFLRAAVVTSFGRNVIKTARRSLNNADFKNIEITTAFYPLMSITLGP